MTKNVKIFHPCHLYHRAVVKKGHNVTHRFVMQPLRNPPLYNSIEKTLAEAVIFVKIFNKVNGTIK
jgi:hypothetical protein